jgi:hypothetical protein
MKVRATLCLALALGAGLGSALLPAPAGAEQRKEVAKPADSASGEKKTGDRVELESKSEKSTPAAAVDFNDAFDLSFASLSSLGTRIDEARRVGDPVGLAQAATELAVAEKVSTKSAPITSEALFKEADELAQRRQQSKELQAVSLLLKDEKRVKVLDKLAAQVKENEEQAAEAFKKGEIPRASINTLVVMNHTPHLIHIRFQGVNVGSVRPYSSHSFSAPPLFYLVEPGSVELVGTSGHKRWGPRYVRGNYNTYHWTLNP